MTHIVCRALICLFWEQGSCSAEEIEYEPDVGCLTFQDIGEFELAEEEDDDLDWEEEEEGQEEAEEEEWEEAWEDEDLDV
jgi:hypothetical protein